MLKEKLVELTKSTKFSINDFVNYQFLHPNGTLYNQPPMYMAFRAAQVLSGKFEGYPLHTITMGIAGTDVAKEASDMVLVDDNFASIVNAVEEGRIIYDNIKKFVKFMVSVNFSQIGVITATILAGLPLPLLPLQILWINLVTDSLPAVALGVEPAERDIMSRKPRNPKESIMGGLGLFMAIAGFIGFVSVLAVFLLEYLNTGNLIKAQTMAVTTSVMFEMLFVFTCRSDESLIKKGFFSNKWLVGAVGISVLIHVALIYSPFGTFFNMIPLGIFDWIRIITFSSIGFVLFEANKMIKERRQIN